MASVNLKRGTPGTRESPACIDYIPALCTHRPVAPSDQKELAGRLCQHAADGDVAKLAVLVANGADINLGDYDDRTALHLAASTNNLGVVEWLIQLPNIDINPVGKKKNIGSDFGASNKKTKKPGRQQCFFPRVTPLTL